MKTFQTLFFILFTLLYACQQGEKAHEEQHFKLTEEISKNKTLMDVKTEPVFSELNFTGKITLNEDKVAKVFPLAGGFVKELYVELGDYVQKGQVLAIIRSPEIAGFVKEGVVAESEKQLAEKHLRTAEELYKSGIISEFDLIAAKKDFQEAEGEYNRIKDVLDMYGAGSGAVYPIKSPVSGLIVGKNISLNMELRTEDITPAFIIGSIENVWVLANIYESDIPKVKEGYEVSVTTISYPDKVFKGKIDKIFGLMDPESKVVKARITLINENFQLKPEMFANIKVLFSENIHKMVVPSSALIFDKNRSFVMVYKSDENIETREVEVYQETSSKVYIESGLKEGEKVMTKYGLLVYDALND